MEPGRQNGWKSLRSVWVLACFAVSLFEVAAEPAPTPGKPKTPLTLEEACSWLDQPRLVGKMDGLRHFLVASCGREDELRGPQSWETGPSTVVEGRSTLAVDAPVNDPQGDLVSTARTQNESSMAWNANTGTLCVGYNDYFHFLHEGLGITGFSRSTDGGATWQDRGAVGALNHGDPSLVWRRLDGKFYYATLRQGGLGLYRSDDDCQTFTDLGAPSTSGDDKELLAVDNHPSSPFYGRLYLVWTDFANDGRITFSYSSNGGVTWAAEQALSPSGQDALGAWPTVAPNGDLYLAYLRLAPPGFPDGVDGEILMMRSTNGGTSFSPLPSPTGVFPLPRDVAATTACGLPALAGGIRHFPFPQLAVDAGGQLHLVYARDPDLFGQGDTVDIFYRRSTDQGASWGPEMRINDDRTTTHQYQPALAVGPAGLTVGYYSRHLDPQGQKFAYFLRSSHDLGASWGPSIQVSDQESSIVVGPDAGGCYHGDYDQHLHLGNVAVAIWSDDRFGNPNLYAERTLVASQLFADGFESGTLAAWAASQP